MSTSSSSSSSSRHWSSDHTAEQLILMYEKSLPSMMSPTIPFHLRSSSSTGGHTIPLDVLPNDIMYVYFDRTCSLALELCTIQGMYDDLDPDDGDYFGDVDIKILKNICNRLGLTVKVDSVGFYKEAIWEFIDEIKLYDDPNASLFNKYIDEFLLKFKSLTVDSDIRRNCIKSFRDFLKQDTVMDYLSKLTDKVFCSIYRIFQLFGNTNQFTTKIGTRPGSEKIITARVVLADYLLNAPTSTPTSTAATGTMVDITSTNINSGTGRIVEIVSGNQSANSNLNSNSNSDSVGIAQLQAQMAAILTMLGKNGQTNPSSHSDFSSLVDAIPAATPQASPSKSVRIRTPSISATPVSSGVGTGQRNAIGSGVSINTNKSNNLFGQLQYMSSGVSGSKVIDSDSDEDDYDSGNNAAIGGGFGGINTATPSSSSSSSSHVINGNVGSGSGSFDTSLYMSDCVVPEESFASILQKEIRSYACHEQYFKQDISGKMVSKQIGFEIGRLFMLCDALHSIGVGNNVPDIYTKHHVYELISRMIVGLQIADQNGTYDTLEGLIGQQKFALPVSIISQLNKARLQGKKLELKKVVDIASNSNGTFNKNNQSHRGNGGFNYNSQRGGRGGTTQRGGGHRGGHRGGFNNNNHQNNNNNGRNGGAGGASTTNPQ